MTNVRINGEEAPIQVQGLNSFGDMIELVKSTIDPDHMITGILVDGEELSDEDWTASPARFSTSIIEVMTGTPKSFVASRIMESPKIVQACYLQFREARKLFQEGESTEANQVLGGAVNTFQAFFEWYGSLLDLMPEQQKADLDISEVVNEIATICKNICQQQLYQSWWALGETIQNQLEPKLDDLETRCRSFQKILAD
jgi:hypothetical protein